MNGFGQNQIRAQAKGLGHARLSFHDGDCQRSRVRTRILCALEQQSRVLLVVAVHHNGIEVLDHQFFHCGKGLVAGLDRKLEFTQNLAHHAGRFFIRAE